MAKVVFLSDAALYGLSFAEAQAKVANSIRAKVFGYDGNLSYVQYFENQAEIEEFIAETGYKVEIL